MVSRFAPPLAMLAVMAGTFPFALAALRRHEDLLAAIALACGALMAAALRASVRLLDP